MQDSGKLIVLAAIVLAMSFCLPAALADKIDFSKCSGPDNHCYTYKPGTIMHPKAGSSWAFNMYMPDGTCNVRGTMNPVDGSCNVGQLRLNDINYTQLKMNPGVFAIRDIANAPTPNINYCPVGLFSVLHEDGYFYKVQNVTNLMYPDFCITETGPNPFPVPEFAGTAIIVSAIAIVAVIAFSARWRLRLK